MMADATLTAFTHEWNAFQQHLIKVIAPMTAEQMALRLAPNLRSAGEIALHIVSARARWLHNFLEEGGPEINAMGSWGGPGDVVRSGDEVAAALEQTWQVLTDALNRWTAAELDEPRERTRGGVTATLTRRWVVWHLIEHDLFHGGELSFVLGANNLPSIDL